jgi:aminopeptidase N
MLVYLPVCYFFDQTVQQQLGLLARDPTYWNVVTAHEVAHQWWGQTVGFGSYRDQWMSEGFANFSAAIYLMRTNKDMKQYRDFWVLLRKRMLEKNAQGKRPVDVGPVVMGTRLNSSKTGGDVYQNLIYPKGAWILHMLHMMYWNSTGKEDTFKLAMHDLMQSYRNQPATTEDFKAVMERNMPAALDVDHNHRLDWFFNAYVYGTEIPKYTVTSEFTEDSVHFKVTQSGVSDDFTMLVPVYMELADKRVIMFGRTVLKGSTTVERTVKLGKMAVPGVRLLTNYNFDLLAE